MDRNPEPQLPRVLNPEAIGDPDQMPIVEMPMEWINLMNPCECGGLNGHHTARCEKGQTR